MDREQAREALNAGRYAILEELGEGGKGVVYTALDTTLDRVVAVKVLKAEGLDREAYARFQREAQAAARLTQANVVATYDMGEEDGRYFLVMEYVDGTSLRDLLEGQPEGHLDLATLLRLGQDLCRALAYAHAHGVLHRDLKPENVMVTKDGTAKLMDFGLALALDKPRMTPSGTMVGTPAYMSPENALGKTSDARSDLYSLGAVLYEMATGRPPFPHEDSLKAIYSHIHDTPVTPSRLNADVTSGLEEVIMRLLAKDPAGRYQSAPDVSRALEQIAESLGRGPSDTSAAQEKAAGPRAPTPEPRKALPLIGREAEVGALHAFVDGAARGEGGVVFLTGEAGIGKTRLGEETAAYAALRGTRVLRGRSYPGQGAVPYAPWIEMLREFVREAPRQLLYKVSGAYAADLGKLVPELLEKVGPAPTPTLGHPDQERLRLFEAVKELCLLLSQETPLLLFLDDLNWADPASLELLHYVARRASGSFLLLLGAYRDVEVMEGSALSQLLFDLNRERLLETVTLPRLQPLHVADMITASLGEEEISEAFRDLVFAKTGGNPFFVEEVLRSLVEEGVIFKTGDRWDRRPIAEIRIPSSVRAVVRQRLDRLDERCNRVLALAAVQGREFDYEVLKRVSLVEEDNLLTSLEDALRARLIKERALAPRRSVFAFADAQVRDVLYDGLSLIRRRQYHAKTARALEEFPQGEEGERVALLAYHYVLAGDAAKALDYSLQAGEAAARVYAYEEASQHLTTALELLEEAEHEPGLTARVLDQLGDATSYQGEPDTAIGHWRRAASIYRDLEERVRQGEALRKVAYAFFMEKHDQREASRWYEKARLILEAEPRGIELARLYNDVARLGWRRGEDPLGAAVMAQSALELAQTLDAPDEVSHAYQTLALLMPTKDKARTMEYLEKGLEIGREGKRYDSTRAYVNLGAAQAGIKGDVPGAIATYEEGLDYVRQAGFSSYRECLRAELAYSGYLPLGAWDEAVELAGSLQETPVMCKLHGVLYPLVTLGLVDLYQGRWGEGEERLKAALEAAATFEEATFVAPQVGLGRLALERGDYQAAEEHLRTACGILRKAGDHIDYVRQLVLPLSLLAELALRTERPEEAAAYAEELAGLVDLLDEEWARAYGHRVQGLIALGGADWGTSEESLRRSIEAWGKLKWPYERGRTLYDLGTMYQQQGDREKAGAALDEALSVFTDLGTETDVEKVLARKDLLKA
ncbi:MAG: serine/threonine-protein kinase PknK [Thermoplasmata archaeon]